MVSQGGGGWGDPLDRIADDVLGDLHDGIISRGAMFDTYGVVLADDAGTIDFEGTSQRRDLLRHLRLSAKN